MALKLQTMLVLLPGIPLPGDDLKGHVLAGIVGNSLRIEKSSGLLGNKRLTALWLEGYVALSVRQGQPARAANLWGTAEVLRETINVALHLATLENYEHHGALAYDALGETAVVAAWASGRTMILEHALIILINQDVIIAL